MDSKIPFTVIGGYLGSGKTTLLNALLRQPHGLKLAVLVNDFGSINIDAELIENKDGETVSLTNGCICCSINDNIGDVLRQLTERPVPLDQVIVEASGVAYPDKIARYGTMPGFTLQGILVVVDAETIRMKSKDKYVGQTVTHQLKDADLLILNKTDLVSDQQKQEVRAWLADMAPKSHIIETQYGLVPNELLLGFESKYEFKENVEEHAHQHGTEFTSWSYESDVPFQSEAFESIVAALPESVVRAKGVIYLQEEPEQRFTLQVMGKRWKLTPGISWASEKPGSRLVFIGVQGQFDPAELSARLENCTEKTKA
jgi:G3E family GTPase